MRMNMRIFSTLTVLAGLGLSATAVAQDSVSNTACLPGDGLSPWSVAEQCNDYVVDLVEFQSSWGTTFAIAPVIKTSKTAAGFFGSLTSSQALSRTQRINLSLSGTYDLWTEPGFGVNDDTNTPPSSSVNLAGMMGNRFGLAFSEFSTTDGGQNYNAIVGGIVQYVPSDPLRLYVSRRMAIVNAPNQNANLSQLGLGSIDPDGNVMFRSDNGGAGGGTADCLNPTCVPALTAFAASEQSIFKVNLSTRSCGSLNVLSDDYLAGGSFDIPATSWLVRNDVNNHNPPGIVPNPTTGGTPLYIGSNFVFQYVRGTANGAITSDGTHFPAGLSDHRGNISWEPTSCAALGASGGGVAAMLGRDAADTADELIVFGIDAAGNVTGKRALVLPAVVTDNDDSQTNIAGVNEFDHYHSQVAFRGGNGHVALGVDQDGNLLAAAQVNHPSDGFTRDWPYNYIAVAKLNCSSGAITWTMAGYNLLDNTGKDILDGPGGTPIGQMTILSLVTGGVPQGPSVSAPMIDSVGNVWFLSAVEMYNGANPNTFNNALLRAVYNKTTFSYELELIAKLGDSFHGANSNLDYLIAFWGIADSNSVDSGTAWSQNVSNTALAGQSVSGLQTKDSRTLGGLVIAAEIIYDSDQDGDFSDGCTGAPVPPDPADDDQDYNVLLYISGVPSCGNNVVDAGEQCDDGNLINGDGCSSTCQSEGFACTTVVDCRLDPADNACNCATCTSGTCQYTCTVYGNANCSGGVTLDDILCILAGFGTFASCPNGDIFPCGGGGSITLDDILQALAAFGGANPCGCLPAGTPALCGSIAP